MSFEIIRPFEIDDTTLIDSSISDTIDYALYSGATTYALANKVVGADHHEYESLVGSNIGNALSDPAKWLDLGFNRKWRMFDLSNTSQSSDDDEIDVEVDVTGRITSVSLLNVEATTVQIIATTVADGEIYNQTFNLVSDSGINNWYEYFFEPIIRVGDLVVTDIPAYADPTIQVIISAPGSTVYIGTLTIGQSLLVGAAVYGATVGIQDYSRKVTDEFGNSSVVQRAFAKRATFKVAVAGSKIDAVVAFLASIRASPCVYKGTDQYASTYIYGFYKDFRQGIDHPGLGYLNIDIEGLT